MDKGMHSDGSMSPSARTAPWPCQNCTNANDAGFTTCVHCDMYHLDAREAGPLVTRLGTEASPTIAGVDSDENRLALYRRFCNSGVPGDSDLRGGDIRQRLQWSAVCKVQRNQSSVQRD